MKQKTLLIFLTIIILSGCTSKLTEVEKFPITIITQTGEVNIAAEAADEPGKIQTGLMHRKNLDANSGILFVFEKQEPVSFWMKNTLISLDMIFIFENGTISEVKTNVQPCHEDPCPTYPSNNPSKYVIEVNAEFCEKNGVNAGDRVNFEVLNSRS
ncbi:MAG: DUF192 domain-containing protein [Candidatus Aenigmarchaeota archaeon]|nr:DUF192 domain-containing protein [Candidatus Aenigmarchaeota archaeon]